jgi:hypothetical protein
MINLELSSGILFYSHNQARYVVSGLNSILAQELNGFVELLIIDDGSSDETVSTIENWLSINTNVLTEKFTSVKFVHRNNQAPLGQTATLLEGLAKLSTDYIFILEGDDEWILPSHMKTMQLIFEKYPWVSACGSSWISLSDSNLIHGAFHKNFDTTLIESLWDARRLLGPNFATLSVMGYRGEIIREFLPELIMCHEVADLGLNLFVSQSGPIFHCDQVSVRWRYVPNSAWRKIPLREQIERSIKMLRDYAQYMDSEISSILEIEADARANALSLSSKVNFGVFHPFKAGRIIMRKLRIRK